MDAGSAPIAPAGSAPIAPALPDPGAAVGWTKADRAPIERAIRLGRRGWGRVHPNPMVGCVIQSGGGVVAEGWHERFGGPHAEVRALEVAGPLARGATAYVSLEPCRHQGKTPPCTGALVSAGIRRVVFAVADPGRDSGGGAEVLRSAGVEVVGPTHGVEVGEAENAAFFHGAADRPHLTLKLAVSRDGMIAEAPGRRTDISAASTRTWVHRLRAGFDAIMVGSGTARIDDPLLTVRDGSRSERPPMRVVLDSGASLAPTAAMFDAADGGEIVVLHGPGAPAARLSALVEAGARTIPVATAARGLDAARALEALRSEGCRSVLSEGGAELAASLLAADLVDRLVLLVSPEALGRGGVRVPDAISARSGAGGGWGPAREDGWRQIELEAGPTGDTLVIFDRDRGRNAAGDPTPSSTG